MSLYPFAKRKDDRPPVPKRVRKSLLAKLPHASWAHFISGLIPKLHKTPDAFLYDPITQHQYYYIRLFNAISNEMHERTNHIIPFEIIHCIHMLVQDRSDYISAFAAHLHEMEHMEKYFVLEGNYFSSYPVHQMLETE